MLTVGSLFSGCGGFDLGFEQAGFRAAWQCEIDSLARSVLAAHWRTVPCYEDVRALSGADIAPVDVIAAGFPCQDLSVAGQRQGLAGARSGLFFEIVRIARAMREATHDRYPACLVLENVPGLLTSRRGADFRVVRDALAECGAVDICWRTLDAQYFGVAQRRRRVFLVVDLGSCRGRAREVLFESEGVRRDSQARGTARADVAATLGRGASGAGGYRNDLDSAGAYDVGSRAYPTTGERVVNALTRRMVGGGGGADDNAAQAGHLIPSRAVTAPAREGKGPDSDATTTLIVASAVTASYGHDGRSSPRGDGTDNLVPVAFNHTQDPISSTVAPALAAEGQAVAFNWQAAGAGNDTSFRGGGRAWVTRAGDYTGSLGATKRDAVMHDYAVRRLLPVECERLQGLPDNWTRWGADGREIADTHRYRLVGNAVCVPVARWIAGRLVKALTG